MDCWRPSAIRPPYADGPRPGCYVTALSLDPRLPPATLRPAQPMTQRCPRSVRPLHRVVFILTMGPSAVIGCSTVDLAADDFPMLMTAVPARVKPATVLPWLGTVV
ncbi:hypothetical protein GCM10020218_034610 [Dactylosporangium vinaceum]